MAGLSETAARGLRALVAEAPLTVRIQGDCMVPLLYSGAVVQVRRQRFYWPGDVIVTQAPDGRLLAHRLIGGFVRASRLVWVTHSDRAVGADAPIPSERILGKVAAGEASPLLIRIPLRHRLRAVFRFSRLVFRYLLKCIKGKS